MEGDQAIAVKRCIMDLFNSHHNFFTYVRVEVQFEDLKRIQYTIFRQPLDFVHPLWWFIGFTKVKMNLYRWDYRKWQMLS